MKKFWEITKAELVSIFKDGGAMLILLGAMLIYGTIYPLVYAPQVVRKFPVAVVDLDHTARSRELTRMLDATPQAAVRYEAESLEEAKSLFLHRKVYGVLYIPNGFQKRILAGEQSYVSFYADGGYFLLYSDFLNAVSNVVITAGAEVQMGTLMAAGLNKKEAEWMARPVDYRVNVLYNPGGGYGTAIMPGVLVLISQQLLLVGIGLVCGTWYERRMWHRFRGYGTGRLVLGKTLAYLILYVPLMLYMFGFQYKFFDYPMKGSHWSVLAVFVPYLLSIIFLGLTIGTFFKRRESSMLVIVVTSVMFLAVSGITWSTVGMPQWMYALGRMMPSSNGMNAVVRIRTMGATLADVGPEFITLWVLTGIYGLTAVLAIGRRMRRLPMLEVPASFSETELPAVVEQQQEKTE